MPRVLDNVVINMATVGATILDLPTSTTIDTTNMGVIAVNCLGPGITGNDIRLSPGGFVGQMLCILNVSSYSVAPPTVSFAPPAISLVADADTGGVNSEINSAYARAFVWNGSLWVGEFTF